MNTITSPSAVDVATSGLSGLGAPQPPAGNSKEAELRSTFDKFVGQTFYSQMLQAMRKTVDKPAHFHGGRGEEVFTKHLDQVLGEKLAQASAGRFSGPMCELFMLGRK